MVREPILLRSVLHDREIEVALTMARIEPLSTQPGPLPASRWPLQGSAAGQRRRIRSSGPWCRRIRIIRRSTRSARRCVRPTSGAFRLSAEAERHRQRRRRVPEIGLANSRRRGAGQQHGCADVLSAHHWRHRDVHALQRVADRQPHASGGEPGHGRTRNAACYRAAGAARCRHRLHESAARRGDP